MPLFSITPALALVRSAMRSTCVVAVLVTLTWLPIRASAQTGTTAPGDPILRLTQVFPKTPSWRPVTALIFDVDIEHPRAGRGLTVPAWRTSPTGGWGSALRLVVTDADGTAVSWPFRLSAPKKDQPLVVSALLTAGAALAFDPRTTNIPVRPGPYTVRAELAVDSGDGWRGRVVSNPVSVTVLGPIEPQLTLEPLITGPLVQGWPWGALVSLSLPTDRDARTLQIPGHSRDWPTNTQLILRNAQGAQVAAAWIPPRLPPSDDRWLDPGETFGPAVFRLPTNVTAALPTGSYTLTARYTSSLKHAVFDYWNGSIESPPLRVSVEPEPASPDVPTLALEQRWLAEDALEEATVLRIAASEVGVPTDRRLELTRQAAAPLLRAESAGQRWVLLDPTSPAPAGLMARIYVAQDDRTEALAWAQLALDLDAANPVTDPELPPDSPPPDPAPANLLLLQARRQVDALPEVPNAQLTPELQFALNLARGTLPDPTNVVQQDRYFIADPRGQWAASAVASSEYRTPAYSAARATGAPDVQFYGDNVNSWASKLADAPDEWIELTFPQPTRAAAVRVRQNNNPGALVRIDLLAADGSVQTVFQGTDTNAYPRATIGWLVVRFPTTAKPVAKVRLTLDSVRVRGWNEIDAVQLVAGVVAPVLPPRLTFAPRAAGSDELVIATWPEGFVLERATRLAPPDWQAHATQGPVRIRLNAAPEFFRLSNSP